MKYALVYCLIAFDRTLSKGFIRDNTYTQGPFPLGYFEVSSLKAESY